MLISLRITNFFDRTINVQKMPTVSETDSAKPHQKCQETHCNLELVPGWESHLLFSLIFSPEMFILMGSGLLAFG